MPSHSPTLTFQDDLERIILLGRYRKILEQTRSAMPGLLNLRDELLQRPHSQKWVSTSDSDLQSIQYWVTALISVLDQHDPLKDVLAVKEDFLGVYEYNMKAIFAEDQR